MSSLTEVALKIGKQQEILERSEDHLSSISDKIERFLSSSSSLQNLEDKSERSRGGAGAINQTSVAGAGRGGSRLGNLGGAAALGLGGLAAGAMRGLGGLALMGAAIPTFFGGLLLGSEGMSYLQDVKGMDFEGLKTAALGFSDIVQALEPEAFLALGAITAISVVGGKKGAIGLGTMGFAISAFLTGLLAGDLIFSGVTALGGDMQFDSMQKAVVGASTIFNGLDTKGMIALGGLLGASTLASAFGGGSKAAKGLAFMGLGISGFLAGLLAGDLLFAGVNALGVDIDFSNVKTMLAGFSSAIGELTLPAVTALGALMAGGALVGYSPLKAKSLAKGLFAISAGIVALMAGFAAVELIGAGSLAIGASVDFSNVEKIMAGFSASIGSLDEKAVIALGSLLTAGGVLGAITTGTGKSNFVMGVSALAASIVAFMGAFALGDAAASAMGADGSSIKNVVANFGEAINSLDDRAITVLGTLIGVGGILGAATAMTGGAGALVFAGIPALGASIAGFFLAFDGLSKLGSVLGVDGSSTKELMKNFSAGISELVGTDMSNAAAVGTGLVSLSKGMAAFFGQQALGGVVDFFGGIKGAFQDGWNYLFGKESEDLSPMASMVKSLEPLKDLDDALITKMDSFGVAINSFVRSFEGLNNIDTSTVTGSLSRLMADIGSVMAMMDTMLKGGVYDTGTGPAIRFFGNKRGLIDFGPGLNNLDDQDLRTVASGISNIRSALSGTGLLAEGGGAGGGTTVINNYYNTQAAPATSTATFGFLAPPPLTNDVFSSVQ